MEKSLKHILWGSTMDEIKESLLREGDVILYNGNGWISKAIRFIDGTEVNHAAVFLGGGMVGEAIGQGLTERSFQKSTEDDRHVIVSRLSVQIGTMKPVVEKANAYLRFGNRYGFEQILLLAFLGITRKLPVNAYLKWMLRKVLDQAAQFLMDAGKKQPLICSEFVYRCYNEALPISTDPYTLRINEFPTVAGEGGSRARAVSAAPHRLRMHADSLLAWTEDVMMSRRQPGVDPLVIALERPKGTRGTAKLSAADKKMAALDVDSLIEKYLEETKKPRVRAFDAEASLRDSDMLAGIVKFAETYYQATRKKGGKKAESGSAKTAKSEAPAALRYLLATIEDFVTPGDLLKCGDLFHVGKIMMK
jgi:hypothetical protein